MEIFVRNNALPEHDKQAMLSAVQELYPKILGVEVHLCFFLWLDEPLEELNKRYCQSLLCAEHTDPKHFWRSSQDVLITARVGTKTQQSYILQNIARKCKIYEISKVMAGLQYRFSIEDNQSLSDHEKTDIMRHMHDQSSHRVLTNLSALAGVFSHMNEPHEAMPIGLEDLGDESLRSMSTQLDLGLSDKTIKRLYNLYTNDFKRNPYDLEVISFFDALSIQDRIEFLNNSKKSFLSDIKQANHDDQQIISAYKVHSTIYNRARRKNYYRCLDTGLYKTREMQKFTTGFTRQYQNLDACPFECGASAISFAIAQSSSVGAGSKPKAHVLALAVADRTKQEQTQQKLSVASAKQTLLDANIGIAQYANATGIPLVVACYQTLGYSYGQKYNAGLDKPLIINKVLGEVFEKNVRDKSIAPGDEIVLLGCPVMNVGDVATKLAGGAVCPSFDHMHHAGIDMLSINQVDMQNRALNVINACGELDDNPLSVVEALGEGGLTRALLYILKADKEQNYGFHIQLRNIHTIRNNFTAMQIWGSEMQERYLVLCAPEKMEKLLHYADREQCPYTTIGRVINEPKLEIYDDYFDKYYMDINHSHLTDTKEDACVSAKHEPIRFSGPDHDIINAQKALMQILMSSSLCSKNFLLKNHDTYNGGLVVSGPYIGRTQVPIGYYGLIRQGFIDFTGELLVVTERLALSCVDPINASKLAIADALIRAAAVDFDAKSLAYELQWVCEQKCPGATQDLQKVIKKVYADVQQHLPGNITETKISTKHSTQPKSEPNDTMTMMPPSCMVNLTVEVQDTRLHKTPMVDYDHNDANILWIQLGKNEKACLAGSVLNQEHNSFGQSVAHVDFSTIAKWLEVSKLINKNQEVYAYQPVGQGGLAFACAQMVMAGELGLGLSLTQKQCQDNKGLFSEALGVVLVLSQDATVEVNKLLEQYGLAKHAHTIGKTIKNRALIVSVESEEVINISERLLHEGWEYQGRDLLNERGKYEHNVLRLNNANINYDNFTLNQQQWLVSNDKPKVGMLVEPGAYGAHNLAAALNAVGFAVIEFSLADIINHHENLLAFAGLILPNGQTYQAVGKAGRIVAMQILREPKLKAMFSEFFKSPYTFTLAVGDGAHIVSELRSIIPGAGKWPHITKNENKQVENRWVMAKINENTKSILMDGMQGSTLPLCVAHKHGQVYFRDPSLLKHDTQCQQQLVAQYVNAENEVAVSYPYNPNGSMAASCGFCSEDGKVTAMIGLPERGFHPTQMPFNDPSFKSYGPWLRLFANARQWVEDNPQPPIRF